MINAEIVRAAIADALPGYDLNALKDSQAFRDAGIDSLDHVNILLALEEGHGLIVPDADVKQCNSIDAILAYASQA